MSPARRGKVWWSLGAVAALVVLIIAYVSGVLPIGKAKEEKRALCWVSPQNPSYIKAAPGKDPEGHALVPVYATPAGGKPGGPGVAPAAAPAPAAQPERQIKAYHCPMHPEVVSSKPGKCPKCGMELTPIYGEAPAAAPAAPIATPAPTAKKERKIKYWVDPMDPNYVRDKPGKAPCGMDLVPVYEEGEERQPPASSPSPPPPSSPWASAPPKWRSSP